MIMRRKTVLITAGLVLALGTYGCKVRDEHDQVSSGAHGPASPATSGEHGADAFNRSPYMENKSKADAEHQTAGLMPEFTNGKVDPTMEGSGNLAWQGSYEREKRNGQQAQHENPVNPHLNAMPRPQPPMTTPPRAQPGSPGQP
jgi:hypothetical protein